MPRFKCEWKFQNVMHDAHGRTGTQDIEAPTVEEARRHVQDAASREICGWTTLATYVHVDVTEHNARW